MFSDFFYDRFPKVYVKFNGVIENEAEFDDFLRRWIELYDNKREFTFIFDTREMGIMGVKYCKKMADFIKSIKKRDIQYLQRSIIIVKNTYIKWLLWLIFKLESPVAPVYITDIHHDFMINFMYNKIVNNEKLTDDVIIIRPK